MAPREKTTASTKGKPVVKTSTQAKSRLSSRKRKQTTLFQLVNPASIVQPKKRKLAAKNISPPVQKGAQKKIKNSKVKVGKTEKRKKLDNKVQKGRVEKQGKTKEPKIKSVPKKGNEKLLRRDGIKQYNTNPFFDKPNEDYISNQNQHRLLIADILRNKTTRLHNAISNNSIAHHDLTRNISYDVKMNITKAILFSGDKKLCSKHFASKSNLDQRKYRGVEVNLLKQKSSGVSNFYMLGRHTRQVEMTRGGREGNNAFLNFEGGSESKHAIWVELVERNTKYSDLSYFSSFTNSPFSKNYLNSSVVNAVRMGHKELAAAIAKAEAKDNLNDLHRYTLTGLNAPDRILPVSVVKKGFNNANITPVHTAAINGDTKILDRLSQVDPNLNVPDKDNWYTIHYAAVCETPAPLKYMLKMGTLVNLYTKEQQSPLHCAAKAGRAENIKVLTKYICDNEGDIKSEKSLVNARTRKGHTALLIAVYHNRIGAVQALLDCPSVLPDHPSSAGSHKRTPLMLACAMGYKDIVELLISKNALAEAKDQKKRTPLMHAAINGQQHIIAYLLQLGVDIRKTDSSGNSAAHYAAAYGWTECLFQLTQIDPTVLTMLNDWKLSPFSVAYLKGHYRLVSALLEDKYKNHIDINGKDSEGVTLLASILRFTDLSSTDSLYNQLEFLISKGADCTQHDSMGNTILHDFVRLNFSIKDTNNANSLGITVKEFKKIFDLILSNGAKVTVRNEKGFTPIHEAVKAGNVRTLLYLADHVNDFNESFLNKWSCNCNFFHDLFEMPITAFERDLARSDYSFKPEYNDVLPFLKTCITFVSSSGRSITDYLKEQNKFGLTPVVNAMCKLSKMNLTSGSDKNIKAFRRYMNKLFKEAIKLYPGCLTETLTFTENKESRSVVGTALFIGLLDDFELFSVVLGTAGEIGLMIDVFDFKLGEKSLMIRCIETSQKAVEIALTHSNTYNCIEGVHNDILINTTEDEEVKTVNRTVLMLLLEKQYFNQINMLVLKPEDWAALDADGNSVWHYAASSSHPQTISVFKELEKHNIKPTINNLGQTHLHKSILACNKGTNSFLDPLEWLAAKADKSVADKKGCTALHYAFASPDQMDDLTSLSTTKRDPIAVVSVFTTNASSDFVNAADLNGNTALHLAACLDSNISAMSLIKKGANVDIKNKDGNTPLALAILYANKSVALTLIQANACVTENVFITSKKIKDNGEWFWNGSRDTTIEETGVSFIVEQVIKQDTSWESMVYVLLDAQGKNISSFTQLVSCCLREKHFNLANQLLKSIETLLDGKKIEEDYDMLTTFAANYHGVFESGSMEFVAFNRLVDIGSQLVKKNACAPLEMALRNRSWVLYKHIKKLIGEDVFINLKPSEKFGGPLKEILIALQIRIDEQSTAIFEEVLKMKQIRTSAWLSLPVMNTMKHENVKGPFTALGWACLHGFTDIICLLRDHQFDCNAGDILGRTPLMLTVLANQLQSLVALCCEKTVKPVEDKKQETKNTTYYNLIFSNRSRKAKERLNDDKSDDQDSDEDDEESEHDETDISTVKETKPDIVLPEFSKNLKLTNKSLDISVVDKLERNVFHYLIEPFGWENVDMLFFIVQSGVETAKKMLKQNNQFGVSPLSLCRSKHQRDLSRAMLQTLETSNYRRYTVPIPSTEGLNCPYTVDEDSKKFMDALALKDTTVPKKDPVPHKLSDYLDTGVIVKCPETNQFMSVLMNKTDISYGTYGFHNFYRMELIKRKDTDLFILFTNWGRIGTGDGEYQKTPFSTLELAIKEFKSVFKSKTGEEWKALELIEGRPKRYRIVNKIEELKTLADVEIEPYKLPKNEKDVIKRFIADISDVKVLKNYISKDARTQHLPYGRISKEALSKAQEILEECEKLNFEAEMVKERKEDTERITDDLLVLYEKMNNLSSEFYTIARPGSYEYSSLPRLDSGKAIRDSRDLLNMMNEVEVATRILTASTSRPDIDRLLYVKAAIECRFNALTNDDMMSQNILRWIHHTSDSNQRPKIIGIIAVEPKASLQAFNSFASDDKQMYLFHGTKATNLIPILHQGLRTNAVFSRYNGRLFGNGVYLADTFEKSRHYCSPSGENINYMLVCRTSLGMISRQDHGWGSNIDAMQDCHSLHIVGKHEPSGLMNINGVKMPLGPVIINKKCYLPHSEYIVKHSERVLPSYIIMFEN